MPGILRPSVLAAVALLAAAPLAAQGVSGNWITEFDRTVRNEDGAVSSSDKARARIALQQKGDSVTGTFQVLSATEAPGRARQLRGTVSGSKVTLTTEFEATVNMNGETSTRKLTMQYDLTLDGDRLEGTMTNKSGDMDMPTRSFSAWREKP